ncbi:MAG TPA: ABC transporter substrate-binding protein [Mesotoga infera]|uniref:Extracellular solute-binding protein family 3 n=1 Tax=Mesotoga infera TaxID=1236046 RepID=A0A7Z7LEY2_9BACT|nr:ABC transporter substrate-binding protein [Mesotoga infera]MBP8660678.1 amino acid ABC transporter substrate-binding protein [Mesotoga sp.]NLI07432.1 amino acid ABC transporter substrate-binding protein [Thermotogaceae bacterium]SSC12233.1 Extracellular solute-binding protein family 3 [Mesotoga infera]HOI34999.1 ABC transporter substrate-binding protein [Mesotoga infera]HON26670.1 ABC transporter substrate-binding protein [Mesotoga infera]
MKKLLVFVVIALLLVSSTLVATTLENIVKKGKIVVATDMTAVPMQYRDPTGKPTGFTVELMELAAKEMGVQIEWQDMAWESLIPSLLSGKVDMIAANMSMTLTRMKSIRFSDPYFLTGIVAIARKDSPLVSWKDLAAPSVKMGATMGSVHADFIEQTWGKKASLYDNLAEWMTDLKLGRIDSVMDDEMICIELVNKNPDLKILEGYVRPDTYGLAFRQDQDSDSLVNWFNWFIKWEKLTGEYGKIYEKYVGKEWVPSFVVD